MAAQVILTPTWCLNQHQGLMRGDAILEYAREPVQDSAHLAKLIAARSSSWPKAKATPIVVLRNGKRLEVSLRRQHLYLDAGFLEGFRYSDVIIQRPQGEGDQSQAEPCTVAPTTTTFSSMDAALPAEQGAAETDSHQWWYARDQRRLGPHTRSELLRLLADGVVDHNAPVWKRGMSQWMKLAEVPELQALLSDIPPPLPEPEPLLPDAVLSSHPQVESRGIAKVAKQSDKSSSASPPDIAKHPDTGHAGTTKPLGTKWLKYWNYFSLPVGGLLGLFTALGLRGLSAPGFALNVGTIRFDAETLTALVIGVSLLQLVVAYGLHKLELWAWQLNWVIIVLAWISLALSVPPRSTPYPQSELAFLFAFKLILGGVLWIWPNYVYWKKRRGLFPRPPLPG